MELARPQIVSITQNSPSDVIELMICQMHYIKRPITASSGAWAGEAERRPMWLACNRARISRILQAGAVAGARAFSRERGPWPNLTQEARPTGSRVPKPPCAGKL